MATIAATARECIVSLDHCLRRAYSVLAPQNSTLIEDQLGRLSIWAANMGVFAPGRASMDHRLREAPDVLRIVVALLSLVKSRTGDCECLATGILLHPGNAWLFLVPRQVHF